MRGGSPKTSSGSARMASGNNLKVAILAGGYGTRLSEETTVRPKPMVEIGGMPIIWHIMKYYAHFGFRDFVVIGGYRVEFIRDYFLKFRERTRTSLSICRRGYPVHSALAGRLASELLDNRQGTTMTGGRISMPLPVGRRHVFS